MNSINQSNLAISFAVNATVSLRLIGSAMFGATFITWSQVSNYRNFWNTDDSLQINN